MELYLHRYIIFHSVNSDFAFTYYLRERERERERAGIT
jgi:hypothetical protein